MAIPSISIISSSIIVLPNLRFFCAGHNPLANIRFQTPIIQNSQKNHWSSHASSAPALQFPTLSSQVLPRRPYVPKLPTPIHQTPALSPPELQSRSPKNQISKISFWIPCDDPVTSATPCSNAVTPCDEPVTSVAPGTILWRPVPIL